MARRKYALGDDEPGFEMGSGALGDPLPDAPDRSSLLALGIDPLTNDQAPSQTDRFRQQSARTMATLRNVQVGGANAQRPTRRSRKLVQGAAGNASRDALNGRSAEQGRDLGPNFAEFDHGSTLEALPEDIAQRDRAYTEDYVNAGGSGQTSAHQNQKVGMGKGEQQRYALSGLGQAFLSALPLLGHIAGVGSGGGVLDPEVLPPLEGPPGASRSPVIDTNQARPLSAGRMAQKSSLEATPASQSYTDALENQLTRGVGAPRKGLGLGNISEQQASRVTPRVGRMLEPKGRFPEPQLPGRQGSTQIYGKAPWAVEEEYQRAPFFEKGQGRQPTEIRSGFKPKRSFYPADTGEAQFDEGAARAIAKDNTFDAQSPMGKMGSTRIFHDNMSEQPLPEKLPDAPFGGRDMQLQAPGYPQEWANQVPEQMPAPQQFTPPGSGMTTMSPTRMTPDVNILTPEPLPPLDQPVQPQGLTPNDLGIHDNLFSADTAGEFQGTSGDRPSNIGQQGVSSYGNFDRQMAPLQQQLRARGQGPIPSQPMDLENTTTVMSPDELLAAVKIAPDESAAMEVLKKADPGAVARIMNRLPDNIRLALLIWGIAGAEAGYLGATSAQTSTKTPSK